jgi:hypothetical protein
MCTYSINTTRCANVEPAAVKKASLLAGMGLINPISARAAMVACNSRQGLLLMPLAREEAAPGLNKETWRFRRHSALTLGLDRKENVKPGLILRADGQQNVSRVRCLALGAHRFDF